MTAIKYKFLKTIFAVTNKSLQHPHPEVTLKNSRTKQKCHLKFNNLKDETIHRAILNKNSPKRYSLRPPNKSSIYSRFAKRGKKFIHGDTEAAAGCSKKRTRLGTHPESKVRLSVPSKIPASRKSWNPGLRLNKARAVLRETAISYEITSPGSDGAPAKTKLRFSHGTV